MYKTKIIKLLQGLSEDELKTFEKFLSTFPFKMQSNCVKLYKVLIQYYPAFDSPKLVQKKIYYRVFSKNTNYHAGNLRTLASILGKRIQRFFTLQELDQQADNQQLLLLEAYLKRDIPLDLVNEISNNLLNQEAPISANYYLTRFLAYSKLYDLETNLDFDLKQAFFTGLNKNLDLFFSFTKIKLGIENINLFNRNNYQNSIYFIQNIQAFIRKEAQNIPPALLIYVELLDLNLPTVSIKKFEKTLTLFKQKISLLNQVEALEILTILYNFVNTQIKKEKSNLDFKIYRFQLLKLGIAHNLYFKNEQFSASHFFNISISAGTLGEFDWAESFIEKHKIYLPPATKKLDLASTKGVFYYIKANATGDVVSYEISIKNLESIKTKNPVYLKRKKFFLLRAYYENFVKTHDERIFRYCDSFSSYVGRAKYFKEPEKKQLKALIVDLKFLIKARTHPNFSEQKLQKRIAQIRVREYFFHEWMMEMIEEFLQYKTPLSNSL